MTGTTQDGKKVAANQYMSEKGRKGCRPNHAGNKSEPSRHSSAQQERKEKPRRGGEYSQRHH